MVLLNLWEKSRQKKRDDETEGGGEKNENSKIPLPQLLLLICLPVTNCPRLKMEERENFVLWQWYYQNNKEEREKIVLWQWFCQIGEKREIKKLYCGNRVAEIGEMRGKKF